MTNAVRNVVAAAMLILACATVNGADVVMTSGQAIQGGSVALTVSLNPAAEEEFTGFSFRINYDSTILTLDGGASGLGPQPNSANLNAFQVVNGNSVIVSFADSDVLIDSSSSEANRVLATFTFDVGAEAPLGESALSFDQPQQEHNYTAGSVTVVSFGVTATPVDGDDVTDEGANTAVLDITLNTEPTADVTVNIVSLDTSEGTVGTASMTFTDSQGANPWNVAQQVTITGQDDFFDDGDVAYSIRFTTTSTDGNYEGLQTDAPLTNNDDADAAGITLDVNAFTIDEVHLARSHQGEFTVVLDAEPDPAHGDVVLSVVSEDTDEATVDKATLTFTPTGGGTPWDTPQRVTVTAVDDDFDRDDNVTITVSVQNDNGNATFGALNNEQVTVTITDDDTAGFTTTPTALTVPEDGGQGMFAVVLDAQPETDVVIDVVSDNGRATVNKNTLTFTTNDWDTAQDVTVTAADGGGNNPATVTLSINDGQSNDVFDNLVDQQVSVTMTGFTVSETELTIDELHQPARSHEDTFTVVLDTQPTSNVVIDISSDAPGEATVSPTQIIFTPDGNGGPQWNSAQTVTVTAVDDAIDRDGDTATVTITVNDESSDDNFDALLDKTVTVNITNDDTAGISVSALSPGTISEGETATFTVTLDTEPTGNVVIDIDVQEPIVGEGATVDMNPITLNAGNYSTGVTVTVTATDDDRAEEAQNGIPIVLTQVIGEGGTTANEYTAGQAPIDPADLALNINASDPAGVTVSKTTLTTTKNGGADSFTVVLDSQPLNAVTITITGLDDTEGIIDPAEPTVLTFNPSGDNLWNVPQTVTVTGKDDEQGDEPVSYDLTSSAASDDDDYNEISIPNVTVTNFEAGFNINPTTLTTSEDGTTDTFTVTLRTEPTDTVVANVVPAMIGEAMVSSGMLVFTPDGIGGPQWDTPQTVTVTGLDDDIDDGDMTFNITITENGSTSDVRYLNRSDSLEVTNTDNDTAGIVIADDTDLTTSEDGDTASFSVVLTSEPLVEDVVPRAGTVSITITSLDTTEGTVAPQQTVLNFDETNWSIPQTVTINGVDDAIFEPVGNQPFVVEISTTDYVDEDGVAVATQQRDLANTDNEAPPSLTIDNMTVTEGNNATLTVSISHAADQAVTVEVDTADGTATAPGDYTAIVGTVLTWNALDVTTRDVVVTTIDDAAPDPAETLTVVLSNPVNSTIGTGTGTVTITDNEPVAENINEFTKRDEAKEITLLATDIDSGELLFYAGLSTTDSAGFTQLQGAAEVTTAQGGTVTVAPARAQLVVMYTPPLGFSGLDSFQYIAEDDINDPTGRSAIANVNITVGTPLWYPPIDFSAEAGNLVGQFDQHRISVYEQGTDTLVFQTDMDVAKGTIVRTVDYFQAGFGGFLNGTYTWQIHGRNRLDDSLTEPIPADVVGAGAEFQFTVNYPAPRFEGEVGSEIAINAVGGARDDAPGAYNVVFTPLDTSEFDLVVTHTATGLVQRFPTNVFVPLCPESQQNCDLDERVLSVNNMVTFEIFLEEEGTYTVDVDLVNPQAEADFTNAQTPLPTAQQTIEIMGDDAVPTEPGVINEDTMLPFNRTVLNAADGPHTLNWASTGGGQQYFVYLAKDGAGPILNIKSVGEATEVTVDLKPGNYSWAVLVFDAGATSPFKQWTSIHTFTVVDNLSGDPLIIGIDVTGTDVTVDFLGALDGDQAVDIYHSTDGSNWNQSAAVVVIGQQATATFSGSPDEVVGGDPFAGSAAAPGPHYFYVEITNSTAAPQYFFQLVPNP